MRRARLAVAAATLLACAPGCGPAPTAPRETASPGDTHSATNPAPMITLPGGKFVMGDRDQTDAPLHEVSLTAFVIDVHPVTQAFYERVMGNNPSRWKGAQNPVEQVRWSDAVRFCNRRSELEGLRPCYDLGTWECSFDADGYRLPTEAEWEYACRAGTTTAYFFGDDPARLADYAWFEANAAGRPHPVGTRKPNSWGIHDLTGNVWEWCHDRYQVDYYQAAPSQDPRGPNDGRTRVVRGGAWRSGAETCRSGYRYNENPGYADACFGYDIYGFRCVRKAPAKP